MQCQTRMSKAMIELDGRFVFFAIADRAPRWLFSLQYSSTHALYDVPLK
jgi:hypothetical protein